MTAQEIIANPPHAVFRSEQRLIAAISKLCSLQKLVHELRGLLFEVEDREGMPLAAGDIGGGVRRKLARVNRDRQAAILQQPSRRQSDRSASEYRHRGRRLARKQSRSQLRSAPRQRNARSSMTVVVYDQFVSQFLGFHHKSGWPEGAETDDGSDFAVRRDHHRSKTAVIPGKRIQGARPTSVTAANDTPCRHPSCVQELPAIHDILQTNRENYGIAGHYTLITAEESLPGEFDERPTGIQGGR